MSGICDLLIDNNTLHLIYNLAVNSGKGDLFDLSCLIKSIANFCLHEQCLTSVIKSLTFRRGDKYLQCSKKDVTYLV